MVTHASSSGRLRLILHVLLVGSLLVLYGSFLAHPIRLTTLDLGRHLKNGELILQEHVVTQHNRYSYTYPDYPVVNHHWGSGVLFFLVYRQWGFVGLSVLQLVLAGLTWFLMFWLAARCVGVECAALIAVILLPLLGGRADLRPELFSYFLMAVFLVMLWDPVRGVRRSRWVWIVPLLEVCWVNLHIYFFIGVGLLAIFSLHAWLTACATREPQDQRVARRLTGILGLTLVATLCNPAGWEGALYPLKIFDNYAYRIVENQPFWFLERLFHYPPALYLKIALGLLLLSWVVRLVWGRPRLHMAPALLSLFVMAAALIAVRNMALLGLFALPLVAANVRALSPRSSTDRSLWYTLGMIALTALVGLGLIVAEPSYWFRKPCGVGAARQADRLMRFFTEQHLQGPIFNNYDIGGYLIYHLYPRWQVFVDNRPEAYPAAFFRTTYVPMQEDDAVWKREDVRYHFQVILFYRYDATPWAQAFLGRRVFDPDWAPVYVDEDTLMLLRRGGLNQATINRYELPQAMFSITR